MILDFVTSNWPLKDQSRSTAHIVRPTRWAKDHMNQNHPAQEIFTGSTWTIERCKRRPRTSFPNSQKDELKDYERPLVELIIVLFADLLYTKTTEKRLRIGTKSERRGPVICYVINFTGRWRLFFCSDEDDTIRSIGRKNTDILHHRWWSEKIRLPLLSTVCAVFNEKLSMTSCSMNGALLMNDLDRMGFLPIDDSCESGK